MSNPITPEVFEKERVDYYLDGLVDLGDILTSEDKLQKISSSILHLILGTLMFSKGGILLYDKKKNVLTAFSQRGLDMKEGEEISLSKVDIEKLTEKSIFQMDSDQTKDEIDGLNQDIISKLNPKIIVPLSYKNEFLGIVSLCKKFMNQAISDMDLQILSIICHHFSHAVHNSNLIVALNKKSDALNLKLLELETLFDISLAVNSVLDVDELNMEILIRSVGILNASAGAVFFTEKFTPFLKLSTEFNLDEETLSKVIISKNHEVLKPCFDNMEGILLNQFEDEKLKKAFENENLMIAPIKSKTEVLGLICILDKETRQGVAPFEQTDLEMLTAFASQAGVALENARLFTSVLETKNYNENILSSIANGVITLSLLGEVESINPAALKILKMEKAEAVNNPYLMIFPEDENIQNIIEKTLENQEITLEMDIPCHSVGEDARINITCAPLMDQDGGLNGAVITIEDISEERRIKNTFKRYVSDNVVEELLAEGATLELGGESKHITILFSDIRGFTSLSEKMTPHDVVTTLNEYFSAMMNIIFKYNGTLDKIVGDELMVVYGAPLEKEDDPDRAILTAIDMMKTLKELNATRRKKKLKEIDIGIGVNTGEAVSGNIGSETQMDYTVIGDTVNLGARLCSAAKPYEIIISEYTARETSDKFNLEKLDPIMVKGKEKPINIFKVNY